MKQSSVLLGFQDESSVYIIIGIVLVLLFLFVAIVVIGLIIFLVMRKRKKAQQDAMPLEPVIPEAPALADPVSGYAAAAPGAMAEAGVVADAPPAFEAAPPPEEFRPDIAEALPTAQPDSGALDFDPSRTVAITRENTVAISYGYIKFISGVLANERFDVEPEGKYIGREPSLAQIVVGDPRISKRHLWIGVRDGLVRIIDQDSRNGTFVNDPKSERITEATLNPGDTVILGESDVARFEYQM